jgi:hypothetical protein
MREWSVTAQHALMHLTSSVKPREISCDEELWRVQMALIRFREQVSYAIRSGRESKRQLHLAQAEE